MLGRTDQPAEPPLEIVGASATFTVRSRLRLRRPRTVEALRNVSFAVEDREAVGCVGVSGAGKSALAMLLAGLLAPSTGFVRSTGHVGAVFSGRPRLWPDLSAAAAMQILAEMHQLQAGRWHLRRDELVERLELGDMLPRRIQQLSAGQRMRCEIAAALLPEPDVVVLDDVTAGLDAFSRDRIRTFLRQEHGSHLRTMVVTARHLADVEGLCERLVVLDRGSLAFDGGLAELVEKSGVQRVLVVDLVDAGPALEGVAGTRLLAVEAGGRRQRLGFEPGSVSATQVLAEVRRIADVREARFVEPDLADVIHRLGSS